MMKIYYSIIILLLSTLVALCAYSQEQTSDRSELASIIEQERQLKAKKQALLERMQAEEIELKKSLSSLQTDISELDEQLMLKISDVAEETNPPNDQSTAEDIDDNQGNPDSKSNPPKAPFDVKGDDIRGWFLGAGIGTRINLSGDRVKTDGISVAKLADGTLIAQVDKSEEAEIRLLFETHYMFEDVSIFRNSREYKDKNGDLYTHDFTAIDTIQNTITSLASCGLWSLSDRVGDMIGRRGCGPFVAIAFDKDASPEEFALGHMISLGTGEEDSRHFNIGYGIIVDPDSTTIDSNIFKPGTLMIRDEFVSGVEDGTISLTSEEETIGALLMFSTNF